MERAVRVPLVAAMAAGMAAEAMKAMDRERAIAVLELDETALLVLQITRHRGFL